MAIDREKLKPFAKEILTRLEEGFCDEISDATPAQKEAVIKVAVYSAKVGGMAIFGKTTGKAVAYLDLMITHDLGFIAKEKARRIVLNSISGACGGLLKTALAFA